MEPNIIQVLRAASASLAMDWCVNAPFQMGELQVERIGFANIPVVYVMVHCPPRAIGVIGPVVRQFVYRELATAGLQNEIVDFVPTVQSQNRRQRFVDCNEHSPTKGKNKMGGVYRFSFEIKQSCVGLFEWHGSYGRLPQRDTP